MAGSSGVAALIRVHSGGPWVRPGSLVCARGSLGSSGVAVLIWVCPRSRQVSPGFLDSLGCAVVVV